ncbi:asparagine synthase (glutamine-hydrolyzing) [Crocinitomix catalasitica]|uniref:asparagine synthase (glutamine-hydrolyzing) n=1 Tax=Crocinitomix catalasitica TaxID=184607 RepID=UPI000485DE6D|nr:asparagine synthase (glutamine-hydrolyzing) [Crocinitomix catalasitica]
MCGINGIFKYAGISHSEELIKNMNFALKQRGPDAEGIYTDEHIHLGHRRLSIIDPVSSSDQPFTSHDGRYVIVFNGEIYNFKSIKADLDYPFSTNGDTEVVLAAFIKYKEKCLKLFNGMFAFAIWDKKERSLFIARDRMGIKPLYYVLNNEEIIFSSSLKSILSTKLIDKKISENGLVDYLRYQTVHAPYTLIEGVFMLMPGQYLNLVENKEPEFKTYWSPANDYVQSGNSITEVQKNVRQKLSESVERRMVADVPFGAFLSGGIDSSILVALMSKQHNSKVDTFSVDFEEEEFSEAKYAREIAALYKTNHHEIKLDVNDFKDMIPEALSFMDHPSGDGLNTFVVSKKTAEAGVKMALSGLGGDELFAGYSIFNQIGDLQSKKWLSSFPVYLRKQIGNVLYLMKRDVPSAKIQQILKLESFDLEYIYQYYRQVLLDKQVSSLLTSSVLPSSRVLDIVHEQVGYKTAGWNLPSLSRISIAEFSTYMQNTLLRDADQMSMANGLEVRVPFLDHELVAYALGIRDEIKKPTSPKKLLVDSCADLIPESIYNRKKMGFVLPYETWMKGELASFCKERLDQLKNIKYFRSNVLDQYWTEFLNGSKTITWSRIWPLVVLGDWVKENGIGE